MRCVGSELAGQIFGASPQAHLALLRASWASAVGPEVARRTLVVALANRTLVVRVAHGHWRQALLKMRGEVVARLRRSIGPLAPSRLAFVEGALADPPASVARSRSEVQPSAPSQALTDAARSIVDPELRAAFLESAARYLARSAAG